MIFIFFIIVMSVSYSQDYWYNHPELNWKTIETEHFIICFHDGTERSGAEVASIAETIFEKVTSLYDFIPDDKTTIIIEDVDDYSNGGAYFFDNKIIISGKPMDYDLRGAHRWLQDVITHEYTHIVQLGASMKYSRHIPGSYIQILDYGEERREDVLYGYPNKIISYPIPNTTVPPWFAEGTAQYMYEGANYDYWDSIRDMILRDRVLNNNLLSFDEMNTFGKKGIGNESIYNQGFSLVKYIVNEYGENTLKDITKSLSNPLSYSIDKAIREVLNISGQELYDMWKLELEKIYLNQLHINNDKNTYTIIESEGTTNIHPVWSPNGKKYAFLSNKENDYFGQTILYIYDFSDSSETKIKSGIKSAPTWIDNNTIVYSKKSKPNKNGSKFFDLYKYDILEEEEERLTEDLRLFSPIYDRKNKNIYAINTYDGSCNIIKGNHDFSDYRQVTNFNNGMQLFSLCLHDSLLLFDAVENHERNIYSMELDSEHYIFTKDVIPEYINEFQIVDWDVRDPFYSKNKYIQSNDKFGVFNLYFNDGIKEGFITDVKGGAFMPHISNNGDILFSIYKDGGYKIALLENKNIINFSRVGIVNNAIRSDFNDNNQFASYDYYERPSSNLINKGIYLKPENYVIDMSGPFIMPRLMYDYNTLKTGLYLFDNDYLNKLSVLAGASINDKKDIDLFLLFENNEYALSYFFNFYFVTRNVSRNHPFINSANGYIPNINFNIDYSYHLFSTDIGNKFTFKDHRFWLKYTFSKYKQFYNVNTIQDLGYGINETYGDGSHDYFSSHSITLDYEFDGKEKHYLSNMLPKDGFYIKTSISYEKNKIFEEFRVNENLGSYSAYLKPNNTYRYQIDASKYWTLFELNEKYVTLTNNFIHMGLSNKKVDDFLYFFGGGLPGIKGYTFYDPVLQGPDLSILTNTISMPLFTEKSHKLGFVYLNSVSFDLIHQIGKIYSGEIEVYSGSYNEEKIESFDIDFDWEETENYINGRNSEIDYPECFGQFDALDTKNCIPDELEDYIYPDVYSEYNGWDNYSEMLENNSMSMTDFKDRYNSYKQSIGVGIKLYGFSFYSYPTALTYECHIPLSDSWNSDSRHYLKILFDFN